MALTTHTAPIIRRISACLLMLGVGCGSPDAPPTTDCGLDAADRCIDGAVDSTTDAIVDAAADTGPRRDAFIPDSAMPPPRPNVVILMTDDQGWGDTGYNGHPVLQTPHLDQMATEGVRFNRFYSGAPVCSPTRGSAITGRHPFRYGMFHANAGDGPSMYLLPVEEHTLAEALGAAGYATGHFGKWHLGDFEGATRSSPDQHGFETYFSTVRKTPTADPVGYWANGEPVTETLSGDDSAIIVDRALSFMEQAQADERPFFAVLWFHTPHRPIVATDEYLSMYTGTDHERNYWGSLTAMDTAVGALREQLRTWEVDEDTMLWFMSDNGPELVHTDGNPAAGSTGPLRGGKRALFEGGIRVPGLLVWPRALRARVSDVPASTLDLYPTVLDYVGVPASEGPSPLDGRSLRGILEGTESTRRAPITFETIALPAAEPSRAIVDDRYKYLIAANGTEFLFDLPADPSETMNLIGTGTVDPTVIEEFRASLAETAVSWMRSQSGADYP